MHEFGVVVEAEDEMAKVRIRRGSACARCAAKCHAVSELDAIAEVSNPVGAQVGERVDIRLETGRVHKAGLIVYLVPVIALLIGFWLGAKVGSTFGFSGDAVGVVGAFALFVASFFAIGRLFGPGKAGARKFIPRIERVL